MSRPKVRRTLPPLTSLLPEFNGLANVENKSETLYVHLTAIARQLRKATSQPFYSTREASRFFGVTGPSVSRVYKRLEADGLLLSLRGSMTLLRGHKLRPAQPIMGVVALPIYQYGYCRWTDWRFFTNQLTNALRERHYAADLLLNASPHAYEPEFAEWLLQHHPDYVIFFGFNSGVYQTMLQLKDGGIQVIGVGMAPSNLPLPQYLFRWDQALAKALRTSKKAGIRELTVLLSNEEGVAPWLQQVLDQSGLEITLAQPGTRPADKHLEELSPNPHRIIFSPGEEWLSCLSRRYPQSVKSLFRDHKVLTLHRLSLPDHELEGLSLDIVAMDWPAITGRIADDIARKTLPPPGNPSVLHARYWADVPASDFADEF